MDISIGEKEVGRLVIEVSSYGDFLCRMYNIIMLPNMIQVNEVIQ